MTYARLRDILNMFKHDELNQQVQVLVGGKMISMNQVESFRGDVDFAATFGAQPKQVFLTNNKEL